MFSATLHPHDKINHISAAGTAVGREARPGIGLRVDLQARRLVIMPGAQQTAIAIRSEIVVSQNLGNGEAGLDFWYRHRKNFLRLIGSKSNVFI